MTDSIVGRIDDMGSRIDDLEKSIGELIQHAGVQNENINLNSLKIDNKEAGDTLKSSN